MGNSMKLEYKFLSLGLIFGLLIVFLIPPLQAADEDSHFKKAFLVASFHLFPEINDEGQVGNYIPQAIVDFENKQKYLMGNIDAKYAYKSQYIDSHIQVNKGSDVFIEYSTSRSNPILFLPQAIGMLVMKLTIDNPIFNLNNNISPINYLYLGRIFNLLFYLIACFFSIKWIPFLKNTLFLICLMPMTFSLSASLSYDGVIIGTIFLFISLMFKVCYDINVTKINKNYLFSFIFFSIIIIQFKQIYFPLFLLFLLIPYSKFNSKKEKYVWFSIIIASGCFSYLIWSILSNLMLGVGSISTDNNSTEQIKFILGAPFEYIHILVRSVVSNSEFYFISFVGNLGWLDTNFPYVFTILYFIFLIFTSILDNSGKEIKIDIKSKVFITLVALSIIALLETALYIIWTSKNDIGGVGYPYISGVQGRYFIPISIICFAVFKMGLIKHKGLKPLGIYNMIDFIVPRVTVFSLVLTIIIILLRYWIPFVQI